MWGSEGDDGAPIREYVTTLLSYCPLCNSTGPQIRDPGTVPRIEFLRCGNKSGGQSLSWGPTIDGQHFYPGLTEGTPQRHP